MKIKELNQKIFHNASQINKEDYLEALLHCYQRYQDQPKHREQNMDRCMEKWKNIYSYLGSSQMMDEYTLFYRQIRK